MQKDAISWNQAEYAKKDDKKDQVTHKGLEAYETSKDLDTKLLNDSKGTDITILRDEITINKKSNSCN